MSTCRAQSVKSTDQAQFYVTVFYPFPSFPPHSSLFINPEPPIISVHSSANPQHPEPPGLHPYELQSPVCMHFLDCQLVSDKCLSPSFLHDIRLVRLEPICLLLPLVFTNSF